MSSTVEIRSIFAHIRSAVLATAFSCAAMPCSAATHAYDAQDNLTSVTDQRSLVTTYGYSGFDELKTLTSPDTGVTTYT